LFRRITRLSRKALLALINGHDRTRYPIIRQPRLRPQRGRVLLSYLEAPLLWRERSPQFKGHSNKRASREIADAFLELGYEVHAVDWADLNFVPDMDYEVVFDIAYNLARFAEMVDCKTMKLLHRTGSDPYYQNAAERHRIEEVNRRRSGEYAVRRASAYPELERASLQVADFCLVLGNEHTLRTYPEEERGKIMLAPVIASERGRTVKSPVAFVPEKRQFLWFFGGGAVHKGLDLVLEAFSRNPQVTIHIVGDAVKEPDFVQMYENELFRSPNIHCYGNLDPSGSEFREILRDVFCFVAPSCSEGMSPAVATCLQIGLYPIISRDTGVSLLEGAGTYLEALTVEDVERSVMEVREKTHMELSSEIAALQTYALEQFTRQSFRRSVREFLARALC